MGWRSDWRTRAGIVTLALASGLGAAASFDSPAGDAAQPDAEGSVPPVATASTTPPRPPAEPRPRERAHSWLFAHVGIDGSLDLVMLMTEPPRGRTEVLFVPTATSVLVPGQELQPLASILRFGDAQLIDLVVENELGIAIDVVELIDDRALNTLLSRTPTLDVDFPIGIRVDDALGSITFAGGPASVTADQARRLLVGVGSDGELRRLVAGQAILEALAARLVDPAVANGQQVGAPRATTRLIRRMVAVSQRGARFDTLPVDQLLVGDERRYTMDREAVDRLVARRFPGLRLGVTGVRRGVTRPRVEIRNGVGTVGLAAALSRTVVPVGGHVTLAGNVPGFGIRRTAVLFYRDEDADAAAAIYEALGVGRLVRGTPPLGVVDITVIVGQDLLDAIFSNLDDSADSIDG